MRLFRGLLVQSYAALFIALPFAIADAANDDYSTWGYWRNVYLVTNSKGANVTATQTNFPVLIRINPGNFDGLANTADNGSDVRFSLEDGTHLVYAIERWKHTSSSIDTAEIWVLVPSITGNDTTKIKMYWNKSGAGDSSQSTQVFQTTNNFSGVWHLTNEDFTDATSNNYDATNYGTTDTVGMIGTARKFLGSHPDSIRVSGLCGSPSAMTISCWAKVDSIDGAGLRTDIVSVGDICLLNVARSSGGSRDSLAGAYHYNSNWNSMDQPGGAGTVLKQGWKHLAYVCNPSGSSQILYLNGAQVQSAAQSAAIYYTGAGSNTLFGKHANGGNRDFGGVLDEIRIEKTARDANWIKLCYQNQRQTNNRDSLVWFSSSYTASTVYVWDNSTSSGYQAGSGTWGTDKYWTPSGSGTLLFAWPGVGYSAIFDGSDGTYTITISGTQNVDSIAFLNSGYTLSGGTAVNLGTQNGILVASGKTATISTPITGSGGLSKYDAGTLTLSGTNTYTGVTTITGGTLSTSTLANGGSSCNIGASSNAAGNLVFNGGTLQFTGVSSQSTDRNFTINSTGGGIDASGTSTNTITFSGSSTIASGSPTFTLSGSNTSNNTLSGVLSSALSMTKSGAGKWVLSGTNTYSGNTTISDGTLALGAAGVIPDGANKGDVSVTGTLDLNGHSEGINGLSGAGTITSGVSGAVTLTVGNNNDTSTFSGIIQNGSGTVALTKAGSGVLTLGGANTYTGATTVSAGTLLITNTTGSGTGTGSVGVSSGATLGGTGKIGTKASTVTVNSGGTLAPGAGSTGMLMIKNNLTFASGATLNININSATPATGYDQVFDTGTVTLGDATLSLTLGYAPTSGQTFTIIDNDGSEAPGTFNGIAQGGSTTATYNSVVYTFTVSYTGGTGNDVVLTCASTGANKVWTNGGSDNNWNTAANWSPSGVPSSGDTISFQSSQTANCNLNADDTVRAISFTSGYTGTFNFSSHTITICGTFGDFRSGGTITAGTGGIEFNGTTGKAQVFSPKSTGTFPAITHTGTDTLRLSANALSAASFEQSDGKLDFNGKNITMTGDFTVSNGTSYSLVNIGGRKITVGGNAVLEGQQANALYISPASPCSLAVTGTLTAYGATIGNCKAPDGYTSGTANSSTDAGGNYRWTFVTSTEDYTQWHYSKKVYINTKEGGANINSNQVKFPLLVRLTSANFNFSQAQSAGHDIRFSKSTGVHFNYQIERWDQTNSLAEIWVKVDTIKGYNDAQYIWMYWGKSDAADSSKPTQVFETANKFAGVWHLKEDPSGTGAVMLDATSNSNNGTSTGTMLTADLVDAVVGKGVDFDGSNDGITAPDAASLDVTAHVTVSAWFKASALTSWTKIADKAYTSNGAPYSIYCLGFDDASHIRAEMDVGGTQYTVAGTTTLNTTDYFYGTFTFDNSTMKLFLNGVQQGNITSHAGPIATDNVAFSIGMAAYPTYTNFFTGTIDEVQVSDTARSADWIKLCYETQKANQTTVIVQENYSDWTYSKSLYFNTKPSGANVANNVVKFPILVRLDSSNFDFTTSQDSGQDVRFAKSDGTHLYYQIEKWDNANQVAALWVRADTIYGNDSLRYATMYWGNNNVNSMSNGKAVFDTGNGFIGVWHFNNSDFSDATSNGHNASNGGTADTLGPIGGARKFNPVNPDSIIIATPDTLKRPAKFTLSCWVKVDTVDQASNASEFFSITDGAAIRTRGSGTKDSLSGVYYYGSSNWHSIPSPNPSGKLLDQGWKYVAFTCDPSASSQLLYVNGATAGSGGTYADAVSYATGSGKTKFGKNAGGGGNDFGGVLDEVRADKVVRNVDWIKLCYENQKPVQTLVVYSNEDYSQWAYSRKININTTQSGANVATTQVNFPTLIRLTDTNFTFSQALDDGSDVRFASSLGKRLAYQIERWDRINHLAEVWVLADTVKGNNGTQYMTMYWGKTGVGTRSKSADVFDTANGFAGVWHLGEGSGNAFDATANGINDTAKGTVKYQQTGGVGYSDSLTGTSSYFKAGDAYKTLLNMSARDKVTVSAWVNRAGNAAAGAIEGIVGKYQFAGSTNYREYMLGNNSGSGFAFYISADGTSGNETTLSSGFVPTNGTWYYVTGVMDATNMTIFVNGVQKAQSAKAAISATTTAPFKIGLMDDDGSGNKQYFNGEIDEVIVADTNRSADWVKLCYENQKASQTLVDLEDYSQWAYSKKIYINTSTMGLSSYVTKFPLLVRLDATMINFNEPLSNGEDVRFSKADGTHFYYEKEQWDKTNQKAALWVLVDTIFQDNSTQYIKMYWGKSDAVSKSNANAVFDTANSFVAAYHFPVSSDTFGDATYNVNTGTNSGSTPNTSSIIGYGRSFARASSQRIAAADANVLDLTGSLTLSAWINPTSIDTADIIGKDSTAYDLEIIPTKYLRMGSNKTFYLSSAASTISTGSWYHVAATYNSTGNPILFYVNGTQLGNSVTGAAPVATATTLYIGARASGKYFNGGIDEPRVEKACRSADWIKLCYYTQSATQTATQPDTSSELYSTLGVGTTYTSGQLTAATIAAHNWTIKFDATNSGGGISWLSPDSLGAAANQLDLNLFTIITDNDSSSKGASTLTLLDSSNVFVRLLQQRTIGKTNTLPYSIYYTILGSGKVYVRVYTYTASATTPSNGLEFRIGTNGASSITNYHPSATASSCNYFLHSDATSNRSDPCLALFENWSQANSITGTTSGLYTGLKSSTWSLPANRSQAWEFMLDIAHRNWNDSTGVGSYISEYSHPDSLMFYTGTPYLEKAWEDQLSGHWKFEEGTGDTAFDNSGNNNVGARAGSTWTWTAGKWGGGLSLGTGDSVKIVDNTAFNGDLDMGFTILSWINPAASLSSASGIFKKFGSNGYTFTGGSGGVVQLKLNTTTFSGRTSIGSGSWRHVGALYRKKAPNAPDTVKLFVDGKPDTVVTGTYSFDASGTNAAMGVGLNATLDDMRFYNTPLSDDDIKTIYQLGYSSSQGMYMVRADNNSGVNCVMDGGTYHRYFPVFQVTDWWNSAALSANNPYVYINGTQLTYNKDYYVMLDAGAKKLTVGLNRAINSSGTQIYIGGDQVQATTTNTMPQMVWGSKTIKAIDYFWVKNFCGNVFGGPTAHQFFFEWNLNKSSNKGGEMSFMFSSAISPNKVIDTTPSGTTNLLPGTDDNMEASWGYYLADINGTVVPSTKNIHNNFTYSVVESSSVRVILLVNSRNVCDSFNITTQWAIYPTGQVFRWDSIYTAKPISQTYNGFYEDNATTYTVYKNDPGKRAAVSSTTLQDYAIAFLTFKNTNAVLTPKSTTGPWLKDTVISNSGSTRTGIDFEDAHTSPLTVWTSYLPDQINFYLDIQRDTVTSLFMDSVGKGMQSNVENHTTRLVVNGNGSLVNSSAGDLDGDGFNEREGAYVYQADNANTAHFKLYANGDTCRFNPAFRITNYTATTVPQYVFVNSQALVSGFGYNAYLKQATHELILQINQKFCSDADIYISSDKTLAVTMADFNANGGDRIVRLRWHTESEENNLGFFLYRRIKPRFIDSLLKSPAIVLEADSSADSSVEKTPGALFKTKVIGIADTAWKQVNNRIIYGAMAGVSYGRRAYSWLDRDVHNSVQYEYKLVAVDYNNGRDAYDRLAEANPHRILPAAFELYGNFPNPFRAITYLKFDIPVKTRAMLNVYSIQGRLVRHIVRPDKALNPGFYRVMWDCRNDEGRVMASGPYIYRFSAPGFAKAKIMIMIK